MEDTAADVPPTSAQEAHGQEQVQSPPGWIEVFHYAPLWAETRVLYALDDGEWLDAAHAEALQDVPAHMPEPFANHRVFRCKARKLQFVLCDDQHEAWDNNHGANYQISHSGAYLVGDGRVERIRDADEAACERAASKSERYMEIEYESSPLWLTCRMIFRKNTDSEWTPAPGVALRRYGAEANHWFIRLEAQRLEFAVSDDLGNWDSNHEHNYRISEPGKYEVSGGTVKYLGMSDLDSQLKQ